MNEQQLQNWMALASMAITLGVHTVESVKAIFHKSGMTDAELNAVLDHLRDDNTRRREISARIAAGGN